MARLSAGPSPVIRRVNTAPGWVWEGKEWQRAEEEEEEEDSCPAATPAVQELLWTD